MEICDLIQNKLNVHPKELPTYYLKKLFGKKWFGLDCQCTIWRALKDQMPGTLGIKKIYVNLTDDLK